MEDKPVVLLNPEGKPVGELAHDQIDKSYHIVHVAHILIFTREKELVLSELIEQPINTYGGRFATTAAGMLRVGESPLLAAQRTLLHELGLRSLFIQELGTDMAHLVDHSIRKITVCTGEHAPTFENRDGTVERFLPTTRVELEQMILDPQLFSPAFLWIWEKYGTLLPF